MYYNTRVTLNRGGVTWLSTSRPILDHYCSPIFSICLLFTGEVVTGSTRWCDVKPAAVQLFSNPRQRTHLLCLSSFRRSEGIAHSHIAHPSHIAKKAWQRHVNCLGHDNFQAISRRIKEFKSSYLERKNKEFKLHSKDFPHILHKHDRLNFVL